MIILQRFKKQNVIRIPALKLRGLPSTMLLEIKATVSVKMVGTLWGLLVPQCWCTRFGDQTAINNFDRDEGSTRREKTAFG